MGHVHKDPDGHRHRRHSGHCLSALGGYVADGIVQATVRVRVGHRSRNVGRHGIVVWHLTATRAVVNGSRDHGLTGIINGGRHEMLPGIEAIDGLLWLGELHHRLLQVVESPLCKDVVLLVEVQQMVPDGLLGQHFGVADNDDAIAGSSHSHVETARVVEEANPLIFIGSDAGHDD